MRSLILLAALLLGAPASAQPIDPAVAKRIDRILKKTPLIDGHNDLPWALREDFEMRVDGLQADSAQRTPPLMTDMARLRAGRVGGQLWSVYISGTITGPAAVRTTLEQIDVARRLIDAYPKHLAFAATADDIVRIHRSGRIASMFGAEGGNQMAESMATLRQYYELGVRYMTLTHNQTTPWADSATDEPKHDGISAYGETVIGEMNRLGMLLDLSHVSSAAMTDALAMTKAPVIFSHSNAFALNPHPRNVPDEVLRLLTANGGVVMVNFYPVFLSAEVAERGRRRTGEEARLKATYPYSAARVKAEIAAWDRANPVTPVPVGLVADHIEHIARVAGHDHVGLGGDLDGVPFTAVGLEGVDGYPLLFAELIRRGWSDANLARLAGGNFLRALRRAETVAASLKDAPPALDKLPDIRPAAVVARLPLMRALAKVGRNHLHLGDESMTRLFLAALLAGTAGFAGPAAAEVAKPAALTADGVPAVSDALAAQSRPYMESRSAGFAGWNTRDRSMLVSTRFGNVSQLHEVAMPMGMRRQISFEVEPLGGSWSPTGDVLVVSKDNGGDEFFQIHTLANGRLTMLTAGGKSRNGFNGWSHDGKLIGFSSTERNGTDNDLYIMDPRNPASKRRIAELKGGGWAIADFAPGNARVVAAEYISVTKSNLHLIDLATGKMIPIGDHKKDVAYGGAQFAPDGTLWVTSDEGSDVQRLGRLDLASGKFTPVDPTSKWEVDTFAISKDGRTIAVVTNEAGPSKLALLNVASGKMRKVTSIPAGTIGGLEFAPWGTLGLSLNSAKSPTDAYALDPATLKLTRWTQSETGGLDPNVNVEPELVEVKSFDGEKVSGFLYRPDPAKFPGKRPLIVNIHGGPEGQTRPGFMGRNNYLLNEQGIAIFFPNVRGSTGYGKRFVGLDNGPFKREDSVKDIGAYLTRLTADPRLDPARMAVTGGSYGGYMCYASAIAYADRFKGALCNVAISNFVTFLENTQSYRRDLRRVEYGDERVAAQRAKLMDISPLRRISEIKAPLFVVQGANDPRVPKTEADQIVKAIRGQGGTAWYLVGENEGHGFAKKENQDYLFWNTLMFWDQTLLK